MAVDYPIPSWIQTPNYGAISAARANQQMEAIRSAQLMEMQRRKLDQDAAQFNASMMLKQQQLKAETDAQLQRLNAQSEIESHRLQVQAAYNDARINMQQSQLQQGQQKIAFDAYKQKLLEANRAEFSRSVVEGENAGLPLAESYRNTVMRRGAELGLAPGVLSAAVRNSEREQFTPTKTTVDGVDLIQMSPNRFAFKPKQGGGEASATDIPGMPGYRRVSIPGQSDRVLKLPAFKWDRSKEEELEDLRASSMTKASYEPPNKTSKKLSEEKKARLKELTEERAAALAEFNASLQPGAPRQIPMPQQFKSTNTFTLPGMTNEFRIYR